MFDCLHENDKKHKIFFKKNPNLTTLQIQVTTAKLVKSKNQSTTNTLTTQTIIVVA